jgi:hypothetical protein
MAAALGVIVVARVFLDLNDEGFFLLTGVTLALALLVGVLLRASPTSQKRSPDSSRNSRSERE